MNKNDWQWLDMKRDMRRHVGDTAQRHYQKFTNDVSKRKDFKKPGSYVDHISSELDAVTKDNPWKNESKNGNMNKKLIRLTESDLHNIVKESVNRILKEANDHLLSIGGVEDTPFTRNNNKGSNGFRINGAFSGTYDYGMNPASVAMEMMKDKQPFDEFIDYCKQCGINPYDYIDTNDIEVQQWIEDYV